MRPRGPQPEGAAHGRLIGTWAYAEQPRRFIAVGQASCEHWASLSPVRTGGTAQNEGRGYAGGVKTWVRDIPAARPLAAMTMAILRDASSIISSPSITAPLAPPSADV